jgi:hypothetical protein
MPKMGTIFLEDVGGLCFFNNFFRPHAQNAVSDQKIMVRRKVVKYFAIEVEQNA